MADWSSTTQVITDEQDFYQRFGFLANKTSLNLFWDKYFKCLSKLNDDNTVGALREEVKRDKYFWAHKARRLDGIINRYGKKESKNKLLNKSKYEIYIFNG